MDAAADLAHRSLLPETAWKVMARLGLAPASALMTARHRLQVCMQDSV